MSAAWDGGLALGPSLRGGELGKGTRDHADRKGTPLQATRLWACQTIDSYRIVKRVPGRDAHGSVQYHQLFSSRPKELSFELRWASWSDTQHLPRTRWTYAQWRALFPSPLSSPSRILGPDGSYVVPMGSIDSQDVAQIRAGSTY